jgi:hypothetical protein
MAISMDAIDLYCERTVEGLWSEPINALTNLAFLLSAAAALVCWWRAPHRDGACLALIAATAAIAAGSFAFHTLATPHAMWIDILPIAGFAVGYMVLACRRLLRAPAATTWVATGGLAGVTVVTYALSPPAFMAGSPGYFPVLIALAVISWRLRTAAVGRGLALVTVLFAASLTFRSVDAALCGFLPTGTHFLWHLLNAALLYVLLRLAILAPGAPVAQPVAGYPAVGDSGGRSVTGGNRFVAPVLITWP